MYAYISLLSLQLLGFVPPNQCIPSAKMSKECHGPGDLGEGYREVVLY